jgi:hypothetical protein
LDSDHSMDHVLAEMRLLRPLPCAGDYLVVEDSSVNGHPVLPGFGPARMKPSRHTSTSFPMITGMTQRGRANSAGLRRQMDSWSTTNVCLRPPGTPRLTPVSSPGSTASGHHAARPTRIDRATFRRGVRFWLTAS